MSTDGIKPGERAAKRGISLTILAFASGMVVAVGLVGCTGTSGEEIEVPGDFPSAVEVPDGTVIAAAKDNEAWTLTVALDGGDSRQQAIEALTEEGFTLIGEGGTHTNDRVYSFANEDYSVRVGVTIVDRNDVMNYTVVERGTDD